MEAFLIRRDNNFFTIYPEYFDKSLSRKEGRRLRKNNSIEEPKLNEIRLAAQKIGLRIGDIQPDAAYSRKWWEPSGLILIEKKYSKLETIKQIGEEITNIIRPALERKKKELKTTSRSKKRVEKRIKVKTKPSDSSKQAFKIKKRR